MCVVVGVFSDKFGESDYRGVTTWDVAEIDEIVKSQLYLGGRIFTFGGLSISRC